MVRSLIACLLAGALVAGCAYVPVRHSAAAQYCSVLSYEPCLDQVRTGNCVPCPS
jgi:hypothetical protein